MASTIAANIEAPPFYKKTTGFTGRIETEAKNEILYFAGGDMWVSARSSQRRNGQVVKGFRTRPTANVSRGSQGVGTGPTANVSRPS